jgi:hypothetical protein
VLPSKLILFDLTFSLVPGPLFLLASVAFKVSALVSLREGQQMLANILSGNEPFQYMVSEQLNVHQYEEKNPIYLRNLNKCYFPSSLTLAHTCNDNEFNVSV